MGIFLFCYSEIYLGIVSQGITNLKIISKYLLGKLFSFVEILYVNQVNVHNNSNNNSFGIG